MKHLFQIGHKINLGRKHTKEHNQKIRDWSLANNWKLPILKEELSPHWKGDKVSYRNLHRWVIRHLGKALRCSNNPNHKASVYHWANVSGEYKRDLEDWKELCPSCNRLDGVKIADRFLERRIVA